MAIGVFLLPHYMAPFTPVFYVMGLQAMRHLRQWRPGGTPAGVALVRFTVVVCLYMASLRLVAEPLHLTPPQWPIGSWICTWVGPSHIGQQRAQVAAQLDQLPGKHLVLVRYSLDHRPADEWVYNAADIDSSRAVWAHDMGPSQNDELIRYYHDRDVWLVQPDLDQGKLIPYPLSPRPDTSAILSAGQ